MIFYGLYPGNSTLKYHLGEYVLLFPSIFQFILYHLGDMRNIATIYHHLVYVIVCFGDLLGLKSYPVIVGMIVNHEIRIPVKQPVFHGHYFC